jgi:hypothetical protein
MWSYNKFIVNHTIEIDDRHIKRNG